MRSHRPLISLAALAVVTLVPAARAQDAPAAATGYRKELIAQLEDAENKFIGLANAVPQDKFSWRPAPGVRSISEVFVHIAGANFLLPQFAGVTRDRGVQLSRDMEKTMTDKTQIVDMLRKSFAYAKQAVMDVPEAEMNTPVTLFGQQSTKRGVLLLITTHAHEHLGQSIAYARTNGVVPPWSQGEGGGD